MSIVVVVTGEEKREGKLSIDVVIGWKMEDRLVRYPRRLRHNKLFNSSLAVNYGFLIDKF